MDGPTFPTRIVPCVMMNWYLYARIRGKMIDTSQVAMVPRVQRTMCQGNSGFLRNNHVLSYAYVSHRVAGSGRATSTNGD
jgi:hypothetical protein